MVEHSPYKRGGAGSNPAAPTGKDQVRPHIGLSKTIPGISAGTTGACSGWERGPACGRAASSSISRAPRTDSRYHRHCRGLHGGEPDGCRGVQELGRPAWPNGRRPDRIGRAPAQYLPTALAHRWTPLGAKHIRRAFQDVCESTRLGRDRAPRDLRHVRLAVVCQWEAVEKIARLAGRPAVYLGRRRPTAVI